MSIPDFIALAIRLIADKHDLNGLCIKFATLVSGHVHVPLASEDAKMRDIRYFARVPYLVRCTPLECTGGRAIINVQSSIPR